MPNMPGKKLFGTLDPDFQIQRQQDIEIFLNQFLNHPSVKTMDETISYLLAKAMT